ncbi:MAG: T9SS type A sorting domain-containing protein [Ignavibacteria bacterium]|nr:T9SS type A sorting domain-containing protein [Ignavibacteria bacterium]
MLRLILASYFTLCLVVGLRAEDTISVPSETVLTRGQVAVIEVGGSLSQSGRTQLTFRYPRTVIAIQGARGADVYAFQCPDITMISDIQTDDTTGEVILECSNVGPGQSQMILLLDVLALYGRETQGLLSPRRLTVNGTEVGDVVFNPGRIRLTGGSRPSDQSIEAITGNFPNPFSLNTEFVYVVAEDSNPQFVILNVTGQIVKDLGAIASFKGENRLKVELEQNELGQGHYMIRMITDLGVYFYSFMKLN